MIYIIYGTLEFRINDEINKILKDNDIDDINVSRFNLEETYIKDIIDDCQTLSLFSYKKAVIVENSYIFIRTTKKYLEQDTSILEEYIKNPNPDTILIFKVFNEKLDSVKKINKLMQTKAIIKEFNMPKNIKDYTKKLFSDYKISDECIDLLIKRVGNDVNILKQESEKLKLYKINDKTIIKKDILDLSVNTIDTNIFNFIDNIIMKNKDAALISYQELLKLNEEPIKIIIMLANKFRLMYQACELSKRGFSPQTIADKLNQKKYPVELAINKGFKYDSKILLDILDNLAKMDTDIKMGLIDKEMALELFILRL